MEKEKELLEEIKKLVCEVPNDYKLGSLIRSLVESQREQDKK
jgi:hypothetical protein